MPSSPAESLPRLPKKPLVEALVEIKWGSERDPDDDYPLHVGMLYEKLRSEYPHVHHLIPSSVPVQMTMNMVRHQYRKAENGWPLVQVGPGILTFNETLAYSWIDFRSRVTKVVDASFSVHPKKDALPVKSVLVRYINALDVDYSRKNALTFLMENMQLQIELRESLFKDGNVDRKPRDLLINLGFPSQKPKGVVVVRVATGNLREHDKPVLVWELQFSTTERDLPSLPGGFGEWLDQAHAVIDGWFYGLADGPLLEGFKKP